MSRNVIGCFGVLLLFVTASPLTAWSQSARIGAWQQSGISACSVDIPAGGIVIINIRLDAAPAPIKAAKFKVVPSVPIASIPAGGRDYNLTFTPCLAPGASMTITVVNNPSAVTGCEFDIVPATGESQILLTDCNGYPMWGGDTFSEPYCDNFSFLIAPYRPIPANGATNVPITTALSFFSGEASDVALSTTPFEYMNAPIICSNNPVWDVPVCTTPIDPGVLQPNTTYYWQADVQCSSCPHGGVAFSPLFSFTTAGPVATEQASWGSVKALYRE